MMVALQARGLPASWLNGWLAAVGATVLVPELRLAWTDDPVPFAMLGHDGGSDVAESIADALPTLDALGRLTIARHRSDAPELPRTATLSAFHARVHLVHNGVVAAEDRSLELSMTDLYDLSSDKVPHAPFDPTVPKGLTLYERVVSCRTAIDGLGKPVETVRASLLGRGQRVQDNGLGFDYRRSAPGTHPKSGAGKIQPYIDPVVETLAFAGLYLFPLRGTGRAHQQPRQRGFTDRATQRHAFRWPTWIEPLDAWAIDALLDRFHAEGSRRTSKNDEIRWDRQAVGVLRRLGIHAVFGSVYQDARGKGDPTRAFASTRLR